MTISQENTATQAVEASSKRYRDIAAWVFLAVLCLIYIARTNGIFLFFGGDNAHYTLLAKAIVSGKGYKDFFLPGAPYHTQYPPMFPLMLSGIIAIFGMNVYAMKMLVSLGAAASMVFAFFLLRRRSFAWPLAGIFWLAGSYTFFTQSDRLLTETVFMAFSFGSLWALDKWMQNRKNWSILAVAVLCCWAAQMTRTIGIALVFAAGLSLLIQKPISKKSVAASIIFTAICLMPFALWALRNQSVSNTPTNYLSQLIAQAPGEPAKGAVGIAAIASRIQTNVKFYFYEISEILGADWVNFPAKAVAFSSAAILIFFSIGFALRLKKGIGSTEIYFILYLGIVLLWPFFEDRFILPVYPLLIAYILEGAHFIYNNFTKEKAREKYIVIGLYSIIFIPVICLNATLSYYYNSDLKSEFRLGKVCVDSHLCMLAVSPDYERMLEAAGWLAKNSPAEAVIMARKPTLVALATGRSVQPCPKEVPPDPRGWIEKNNVNFILVDEVYPHAMNFVSAYTNRFKSIENIRPVYENKNTFVLQIAH